MRVAEENFKAVYLLDDREMAALFDYYQHGQFEKDNHPIMCSICDRTDPRPKPAEIKPVRWVDVTWPQTQKTQRFYRQDHPTNAEVLRTSKPINSNDEPKWLRKHLK